MKNLYSKDIIKRAKESLKDNKSDKNTITIDTIKNTRHITELIKIRDSINDNHRKLIIKLHKDFKPNIKSFEKNNILSKIKLYKELLQMAEDKINNRSKETTIMIQSYSDTLNLKELIVEKLLKMGYRFDLTFYKVNHVREILSSVYIPTLNLRISCHELLPSHASYGKVKTILIDKYMTVDEVMEIINYYGTIYG